VARDAEFLAEVIAQKREMAAAGRQPGDDARDQEAAAQLRAA